jgi:uncharacterized protein (TIGR02145 family)
VNYGTDEYDFSAFPGGSRLTNGNYQSIGQNGEWWSATELNEDFAWYRRILYLQSEAYGGQTGKNKGMSVRCIMD